ncbi:MAG: divergent polysaccharide deacetylase family protein, partial [Desulfobacteraceae bacterium]
KRPDMVLQLMKVFGALAILVLLVISVALLAHFLFKRPQDYVAPSVKLPVPKAHERHKPVYEVYTRKPLPPKPVEKLKQLPGDSPPLVAVIIDDIGYDRQVTKELLSLDAPLTFSVLPDGPFSRQLADLARTKGHEIMLHLPMEPKEYPQVDPGPGALLNRMTPDELIGQLARDLDQIPGLKGVNNHMGSGISTSPKRMRQIFSILKKRGLYYIDSRTTAETVARPSAELLQLPFAERDIFIDHFEDEAFIRSQLHKLIERAQQQGYAVGIAHPHEVTHRVLSKLLPQMKEKVELVPASMVVAAEMKAQFAKAQANTE